ncbi:MAG: hypothetical protein AAF360_16255, partial [Pseudomonadota bacterium]
STNRHTITRRDFEPLGKRDRLRLAKRFKIFRKKTCYSFLSSLGDSYRFAGKLPTDDKARPQPSELQPGFVE